jgi:hypothetical protein
MHPAGITSTEADMPTPNLTLKALDIESAGGDVYFLFTVKGDGDVPDGAGVTVDTAKGGRLIRAPFNIAKPDYAFLGSLGDALTYPKSLKFDGFDKPVKIDTEIPEADRNSPAGYFQWLAHFVPQSQGGLKDDPTPESAVEATPEPASDEFDTVLAGPASAVKAHVADIDDLTYIETLITREAEGKGRKTVLATLAGRQGDLATLASTDPVAAAATAQVPKTKGKVKPAPKKNKAAPKKKAAAAPKEPKEPKEPKAAKPKKAKEPKGPSEADIKVSALLDTLEPQITEIVTLYGSGRKARLVLSDLIAKVEAGIKGLVHQPRGMGGKPLYHMVGRVFKTTKRHRNSDWGTCEYHAEVTDTGFKIVHFQGGRTDVKVGAEFKNANDMLKLLTGRDYPRVQVYRYFDEYEDPNTAS